MKRTLLQAARGRRAWAGFAAALLAGAGVLWSGGPAWGAAGQDESTPGLQLADSTGFDVQNLAPGGAFSHDYTLQLAGGGERSVTLQAARADKSSADTSGADKSGMSASGASALEQKAQVSLTLSQNGGAAQALYDGTLADFYARPVTVPVAADASSLLYHLSMRLPDDLDNAYQAQRAACDLQWSVTAVGTSFTARPGGGTAGTAAPVSNPRTGTRSAWTLLAFAPGAALLLLWKRLAPARRR